MPNLHRVESASNGGCGVDDNDTGYEWNQSDKSGNVGEIRLGLDRLFTLGWKALDSMIEKIIENSSNDWRITLVQVQIKSWISIS